MLSGITLFHDSINGKLDIIIDYIQALVYNIRRVVMQCLEEVALRAWQLILIIVSTLYCCFRYMWCAQMLMYKIVSWQGFLNSNYSMCSRAIS